jgi:hypothetical protein
LFNSSVIVRCGLGLRTAALQQGGALFWRERLVLAQDDGAFVKLDVQRVAGLELGVLAQLRREHDFAVVSQNCVHVRKVRAL